MKLPIPSALLAAGLIFGVAACSSSEPEITAMCVQSIPLPNGDWPVVDDYYCEENGNWVPGFYVWHYGGAYNAGHLNGGYRYAPAHFSVVVRPVGYGGYSKTVNRHSGHVTNVTNITVNKTTVNINRTPSRQIRSGDDRRYISRQPARTINSKRR